MTPRSLKAVAKQRVHFLLIHQHMHLGSIQQMPAPRSWLLTFFRGLCCMRSMRRGDAAPLSQALGRKWSCRRIRLHKQTSQIVPVTYGPVGPRNSPVAIISKEPVAWLAPAPEGSLLGPLTEIQGPSL